MPRKKKSDNPQPEVVVEAGSWVAMNGLPLAQEGSVVVGDVEYEPDGESGGFVLKGTKTMDILPSQIVLNRDKVYRMAYRLVVARYNRMTPMEAKTLVEDVFETPWEEMKQYVTENPH